jgi:GNAT superfamily N-acetyltransferase
VLEDSWGVIVIAGGREHRPAALPALVAEDGGERAGLATYLIEGGDCEVVTLDALTVGGGIGGALVEALADTARAAGCARLCLITTNDNLPALRLYQRHGFVLAGVHLDEIAVTRRRKPEIPATGHAGIPIRDELELERRL